MPLDMPKNIAIPILCLLLLAAQCKEIAFNNACDPNSDEYNKSILAKLALKDGSPHCGINLNSILTGGSNSDSNSNKWGTGKWGQMKWSK